MCRSSILGRQLYLAFALCAALSALCISAHATMAGTGDVPPAIATVELNTRNVFKVGRWIPVRVGVDNAYGRSSLRVEVTVKDSDGVPTTAEAALKPAVDEKRATAVVYTKAGRVGDAIEVLLFDGDTRLDSATIRPDGKAKPNSSAVSMPATSDLVVSLAASPYGLKEAVPDRESDPAQPARKVVEISKATDL